MLRRFRSLIRKELLQLVRDPILVIVVVWLFTIEVILCAYALTFDLSEAPLAVVDLDDTPASRSVGDGLDRSPYFRVVVHSSRREVAEELLDRGRALAVLEIPSGWTRKMYRGQAGELQLLIDGANAPTAAAVRGYAHSMLTRYALEAVGRGTASPMPAGLQNRTRVWYNAPLRFLYFNVIAMVALAAMMVAVIHPAASIVKEKEAGTIEQLMVSPIRRLELVYSKVLVTVVLSLVGLTLSLGLVVWFEVPVRGSLVTFYLSSTVFLFSSSGLGVLVATVSDNLQQALLLSFFGLIPVMFLSGTVVPVESMPLVLQRASLLSPLRYYSESLLGLFLKGNGLSVLWPEQLAMAGLGVAIFGLALIRFEAKIGG